jgi:mannose-1-phosphate guanylyltransferase
MGDRMSNLYALIMAGGSGTRLWPLSRKSAPKQLLPLIGDHSMFRLTVERLQPLIPTERIFVVTNAEIADSLQKQEPIVPAANYVIEPSAKDSGPAAALGLAHIAHLDPDAIVAILSADHFVGKIDAFQLAIQTAADVAQQDYIVTLGITPDRPDTGYGYIERGEPVTRNSALPVYHVTRFTEKPTLEVAQQWIADGRHSWNGGMFILTCHTAWHEFLRQQPELSYALRNMQQAIGTDTYTDALAYAWSIAPRKSLDYLIMEGAQKLAVVPTDMNWADIGTWASVFNVLPGDENGNVILGDYLGVDTDHTLVRGDGRLIATVGLSNFVIVDTSDALLICPLDRVQDVKALVEQLRAQHRNDVL